MIHRTASACSQGCPAPVVVYKVFGTEHRARYLRELGQLRGALRVVLMVVPITTTRAWATLVRGERDRVRRALLGDRLFDFGESEVVEV